MRIKTPNTGVPSSEGGEVSGPRGEQPRKEFNLPDTRRRSDNGGDRSQGSERRETQSRRESSDTRDKDTKAAPAEGQKKQEFTPQTGEEVVKVEGVKGISPGVQIQPVQDPVMLLIKNNVAKIEVTKIGDVATGDVTLHLKTQATDLPAVFSDATMKLSREGDNLSVNFSFATPQDAAIAARMVQGNQDQLAALVASLKVNGVNLTELNMGTHAIKLPEKVEIQTPMARGDENYERQGGGQQQQQQQGREEREPPRR